MHRSFRIVVTIVAIAGVCGPARALVNPKFTPVDLVKQADLIMVLRFGDAPKGGMLTAQVVEVLQGEHAAKDIQVNLVGATKPDDVKSIEKLVADGRGKTALFFTARDEKNPQLEKAYIHLDVSWLVVVKEGETWGFDQLSQEMKGTWNGSSDMLDRCVRYILKDVDAANVPVKSGTTWGEATVLGKLEGPVSSMRAVVMAEPGTPSLFIASKAGDRLIHFDSREKAGFRSVDLSSKSIQSTWGDFNGDGRMDLVSWDGKHLWLLTQDAQGKFAAQPLADLAGCTSLATADLGDGKAGVIVGTSSGPRKLVVAPGNTPAPIAENKASDVPDGPSLVADFDGDGQIDVLQLGRAVSLLFGGVKPGTFAPPAACAVALSDGQPCTGDWDADGLLDILIATKAGPRIWHNLGKGQFVESAKASGEVGYAAKENASWVCNADLNNDGRQDQVILYSGSGPQVFFNRGFRSFGMSMSMDLGTGERFAAIAKGQQAGCIANFSGVSCQDLAMVLADGQIVLVKRAPSRDQAIHLRLPPASGPGPVRVWATADDRQLGAWNVQSGSSDGLIARSEAGPLTLNWQFPGGKAQSKKLVLQNNPVTAVLESNPAK